jgi:hypothetical protein
LWNLDGNPRAANITHPTGKPNLEYIASHLDDSNQSDFLLVTISLIQPQAQAKAEKDRVVVEMDVETEEMVTVKRPREEASLAISADMGLSLTKTT